MTTEIPTCYRHPGRETYVSCVRCGRYACPDCMRSASVGQQCVECIKEGHQTARPARNALGARGRSGKGVSVTNALIGINVALFLIELAYPALASDWGMLGGAYCGTQLHGVAAGEWYRLITAAFLPPASTGGGSCGGGASGLGIMDIVFNMWALLFVGPSLERLLGSTRFLGVYLLSALGGNVMFYYVAPTNVLALGASGAIFGLFGAWFVVAKRLNLDLRGISMLIAINLVLGFVLRSTIAWQAHVGGLLTGALLTAAYAYAPTKNRAVFQVAATVLVLAAAIVATVIRTHQLNS
jgi:membrane associated rhomboid family serine protease